MNIEIEDYIKLYNPNTIDIRDNYEYNINHIPSAININMDKLILNPENYLNFYETYYIYCQKGIVTKKVCNILSNLGYKVVEITGGYNSWLVYKNIYN